jgi:sortase A
MPCSLSLPSRRRLLAAAAAAGLLAGAAATSAGAMVYAQAMAAQQAMQQAFDAPGAAPVRPWAGAESEAAGRLTVPRLNISRIVMAIDTGQALAVGPGHVRGTARAGQAGLAVYAGHRDTHFAFLGRLRRGDRVVFAERGGQRFTYEVTGARVVRSDGLAMDPHATASELALATCWPLNSHVRGPLRYVVRARLVS